LSKNHLPALQRTMQLIADAIEDLPVDCRDYAGNA
jgi:hypothetical protein